jgi:hypothetical protein
MSGIRQHQQHRRLQKSLLSQNHKRMNTQSLFIPLTSRPRHSANHAVGHVRDADVLEHLFARWPLADVDARVDVPGAWFTIPMADAVALLRVVDGLAVAAAA